MQQKNDGAVCVGKRRWWPFSASTLAARALLVVLLSPPLMVSLSDEAEAKGGCGMFGGCLEVLKQTNTVDFYAVNKNPNLTLTSRIRLVLTNLRITKGENRDFVLRAGERRFLFRLKREERSKRWQYKYNVRWVKGDPKAKHDNNYIYRLPYEDGKRFRVTQSCHGRFSHQRTNRFAIDFKMPVGTPLYAARGGKVVDLREDSDERGPTRAFVNEANFVIIQHDDLTLGYYFHLKRNGVAVGMGDRVRRGELIGYSGNTGFSRGPHLHFVVKQANSSKLGAESVPTRFFTAGGALSCPRRGIELEAYARTADTEDPVAQLRQDAIKLVGSAPAE